MTTILPNSRQFVLGFPRNDSKRQATLSHLASVGIEAEKFDGMDHEISGLATYHKYEKDAPNSGFRIGPKPTGIYLTHFMAWKVCSYLPNDSFVFFEDDVRFHEDWKHHVDDALVYLPKDWDMLYFGSCCTYNHRGNTKIKNRLSKTDSVQCLHAYAVRAKALLVLIDAAAKIYAPIDITIMTEAKTKLNKYSILPRVADQLDTELTP